ncbi:nitrilotriacetate monooxygenase component A [Gordonia spumicola]|uniref:Nitrilotriacetate monooxygenase component A n=1 Tax=Gordonia spumicola TaxID=589161 RepID=A0A7I9VBU2_9ACTN|nr:NtaA/DmoA family FMN-dependent monooxygenase [Gordonia spumicola]GEE02747.1 nitrilotriacetate monooxygenase component A [Gordonia spumicola]
MSRKQIHIAAHFPGVNNTTVWSDPAAGSHIEFDSFRTFAQEAERGKFDFLFLAEGLRLREQNGEIYDLDVVGRPDTFTILAALAAVTDRLGLAGTINSTFNEPYEVARQFASLDHLSAGRAAWNVVTSWDEFTGENFRRGGFLAESDRYARAESFLSAATTLWDSWNDDDLTDDASDEFLTRGDAGAYSYRDRFFDIEGRFNVPRSPQGRPVIFQAGDSDAGREFAAAEADAIFSRHGDLENGTKFYADVKRRLAKYGRRHDELLILPAVTFIIGDTDAEAADVAHEVRLAQFSAATATRLIEQLWNVPLPDFDADGPFPTFDPVEGESTVSKGRASVRMLGRDAKGIADQWRGIAAAQGLSARETVATAIARGGLVGSPETVADQLDELVQNDAADGVILAPHITPGGLTPFVDRVVPILQERGVYRTDYEGSTLREHLGLAHPDRVATQEAAS